LLVYKNIGSAIKIKENIVAIAAPKIPQNGIKSKFNMIFENAPKNLNKGRRDVLLK
tara:strand:+ start:357 stop:524 length:168 start_codon:yes stop_codon:yes gene_type:complete